MQTDQPDETSPRWIHRELLTAAHCAADWKERCRLYEEYLKHEPNDPAVLFNLGTIRMQEGDKAAHPRDKHAHYVEACEYFTRGMLSPVQDNKTKANCFNNCGLIQLKFGYTDKAKGCFHYAMALDPSHRAARINHGDVQVFDGNYTEAENEFNEILALDPDDGGAKFSRGMIQLLMGDLKNGFDNYRYRFQHAKFQTKPLETDRPMWNGECLDGRTLLLTTEQGCGDIIQFIRYADVIKRAHPTGEVVLCGYPELHALFEGVEGLDGCVKSHTEIDFYYHIPLLHLPYVFGTEVETIPADCPYIAIRDHWKPCIVSPSSKRKIGICWAGSPSHGRDKFRSMSAEQFQRFIDAAPDSQFYSLQCGPRAAEVLRLKNCISMAEHIYDWTDTAQVVKAMDLVITVDTSICHIAGALGVPCWVLIHSGNDWRWMLNRNDSPWYPKHRLFRQEKREEWEPVIQDVIQNL